MKTALCQMKIVTDSAENIRHAAEMVREAAASGAEFIILPEMFVCPYSKYHIHKNAQPAGGGNWQAMSELARECQVYLAAGSMAEIEDGHYYNTAFVFDPEGRQIASYRKSHLFDIDVEGRQSYKESDIVSAGNDMTLFDTAFAKAGLAICYDVRFPAFFEKMAEKGARFFVIPASFNQTTGPVHWELLMRARALDQEAYVFACASAVDRQAAYSGWGHSIAVSPWGEVLGQLDETEGILYTDADFLFQDTVRKSIPIFSQKRKDIYEKP